jgi:hypothetical protein
VNEGSKGGLPETLLGFRIPKAGILSLPERHHRQYFGLRGRVAFLTSKEKEKMNGLTLFLFRKSGIPSALWAPGGEGGVFEGEVHSSERGGRGERKNASYLEHLGLLFK